MPKSVLKKHNGICDVCQEKQQKNAAKQGFSPDNTYPVVNTISEPLQVNDLYISISNNSHHHLINQFAYIIGDIADISVVQQERKNSLESPLLLLIIWIVGGTLVSLFFPLLLFLWILFGAIVVFIVATVSLSPKPAHQVPYVMLKTQYGYGVQCNMMISFRDLSLNFQQGQRVIVLGRIEGFTWPSGCNLIIDGREIYLIKGQ